MSPSEFEAAVSEQAAARHMYLDCLEAALPVCHAGCTSASDRGEYDEAERFDSIEKSARAILAGIEKPRCKADIRAALDRGIIARMQEIEDVQFRQSHHSWQLEKTGVEGEIESAKTQLEHQIRATSECAARSTAQLLEQEKTAAASKDFALAKQMKEAKEASARDGERAVQEQRVSGERAVKALQVRCSTLHCTVGPTLPILSLALVFFFCVT